jgi:TonB family protein
MTALAQALSAALLHFIWQGTLVAFLLWITLSMLRNRTANQRYAASCAALALMAALPALTVWIIYRQPGAVPISAVISAAVPASIQGAARMARESALLEWVAMCRQWALPVWSVGVLVFALRLVLGCRHVAALRRLGQAAEGRIAEMVSLLARRMKAGGHIRVLISNVAESPSVVGWLRPAILLPAATLAGLEPEQLLAVLAHEIAHIRRHDYLVNLAQTMVETLLFYHPAVWWVSARIRHERELCCDDAAVAVCGNAISYARALTSLERLRGVTPRLALGSTGGSLLYRIQRLAGVRPEIGPSKLPGMAVLALALACFATTVHWAKAQPMAQQQPIAEEWGITVSSTGEVLHRGRVPYPEATYKNGIQGTVTLEATLDQSGNVADAHVLSGPPELRKTALQSVLQWQFANGRTGETQQVSITFQQDPRAQAQLRPPDKLAQARLTASFLKDEIRAAHERGDSGAMQSLQEKLQRALEAMALLESRNRAPEDRAPQAGDQTKEFLYEGQVFRMDQRLAAARKSLSETDPAAVALMRQIDALNEQIAKFKQANQGRLAGTADSSESMRLLESQYALLMERMELARQSLSERNPQAVALAGQIEALRKKMDTASFVGSPLARIEISGLPDSARDELAIGATIKIGEVLSQESMESAIAAVHQFDQRLECRFQRNGNGDVVLRISGPEQRK